MEALRLRAGYLRWLSKGPRWSPSSCKAERIASLVDGLRQVLETDAPRGSIRLLVKESGGDRDAVKTAAAEFEKGGADLLVTFSTTVSIAAKEATQRIPIVFVAAATREYRFIQSISHPGDRLNGVASFRTEITPKRFALLKEMIPGLNA